MSNKLFKYPIGSKFCAVGKYYQTVETVIAHHITFDQDGNFVKKRYVTTRYVYDRHLIKDDVTEDTLDCGIKLKCSC